MSKKEYDVAIRIQALDAEGKPVGIRMGENGIEPGQSDCIVVMNQKIHLDLVNTVGVEPVDQEISVQAFHDISDHAGVYFNKLFVRTEQSHTFPVRITDPIRAINLKLPGDTIVLCAREDVPALTLTHPEITGFRFTRIIPPAGKVK